MLRNIARLRVLLYVENDTWIAQCIDHDIAAQAESPVKVIQSFKRILTAQLMYEHQTGRSVFQGIDAPPVEFEHAFEEGLPLTLPEIEIADHVEVQEFRLAA